ncbi:MAG: DUF1176 domain-containing protein [Sandaracinaceae bacterium]|nr:DUF1176 domain-containing protein [Sandaracinaceae bacterium]
MKRAAIRGAVVLLALLGSAGPVRADRNEDRMRALVVRDAALRFAECSRDAEEPDAPAEVELLALGPGEGLALVRSPCHVALDGAYNFAAHVVHVRAGRVALARFMPLPAWSSAAPACVEGGDDSPVWNARLFRRGREVLLSTEIRDRGIGDSGCEALHRWNGLALELIELRLRDGAGALVEDVGPFPIVAPAARACRPRIELAGAGRLRLSAVHGAREHAIEVAIEDTACAVVVDAIACGPPEQPTVHYVSASRGRYWVLVRVDRDGAAREVARIARRCAL